MDIRKAYDIEYNELMKKPYGYMVTLDKDSLMLRSVNSKEMQITACCMVCDYIYEKGFNNVAKILKTKRGKYYIKDEKSIYVLIDKEVEKKFKIKSKKDAVDIAYTLAQFHNLSEGYVPLAGVKLDVLWGRKIKKYKKLTCCIEKFNDLLSDTNNPDEFCNVSLDYINDLLKRAKIITKFLHSNEYINYLEDSMKRKEICINSMSINTFKFYEGSLILDDIYNIGYNMVEEDIALLVKRAIYEAKDKAVFNDIIKEYRTWRKLDDFSLDIIKALVSYPYDSIKIIEKYIKDPSKGEELTAKFIKYLKRDMITDILEVQKFGVQV